MKVGDVIYDAGLGRVGIVLEIMEKCPELGNLPVHICYYRIMYDDGHVEAVRDVEVQPVEELL